MALAALILLGAAVYLIHKDQAGFWTFLGLAVLYAVTQSGSKGFLAIIGGLRDLLSDKTKPKGH